MLFIEVFYYWFVVFEIKINVGDDFCILKIDKIVIWIINVKLLYIIKYFLLIM